jgi:hypothetical protein
MRTKALAMLAILLLLAVAAAYAQEAAAPAAPKYTVTSVSGGGSLTGTMKVKGVAPKAGTIPTTKDQSVCHAFVPDESVVAGKDGGLANVIVYFVGITSGKDPKTLPPAVLQNKECRYHPHVQAMMVGNDLTVTNDDPILHNSHGYAVGDQTVFNRALPTQGMKQPVKIKKSGLMHIKCDAGHTWMNGFIMAVESPYYAVSDADGKFTIADIPPGSYTVKIWHEKFGEQEQKVTITAGKPTALDLTLGG